MFYRMAVYSTDEFIDWKQIYPDYVSKSITGYQGYIVFTNGLILQRGAYTTADGILNSKNLYTMNIVLPISFTSEDQDTWSKSCFLTFAGYSSNYSKIYSLSGTVIKSNIQVLSETNINETFYWLAIGY